MSVQKTLSEHLGCCFGELIAPYLVPCAAIFGSFRKPPTHTYVKIQFAVFIQLYLTANILSRTNVCGGTKRRIGSTECLLLQNNAVETKREHFIGFRANSAQISKAAI
jgi:hypothetical protein